MDFKSCRDKIEPVQEKMAEANSKVPVLNNMAAALIKQNHQARASSILEEVLKLDPYNVKAHARMLTTLSAVGQLDQCRERLKKVRELIKTNKFSEKDAKWVQLQIAPVDRQLKEQARKDAAFSKNIFGSGQLYADKEPEKEEELTPEQIAAIEYETAWQEEAEYLSSLSNFHWFIYPFWKTIEAGCDKLFGCKKKLEADNATRRAAKFARMEDLQRQRAEEKK